MVKRLSTLFIIALLLFVIPLSISTRFRDAAIRITKPIGSSLIRRNVAIYNLISSIRQIPTLRDDKSRLERQLITLQQSLSNKEQIEQENETLRKEAGVSGVTKDAPKVLTHVILQGSDPLDRTLIIDAGSNQGIKVGQAAISQGALIGKVISVRQDSAVVRSILSKESRIQAWISVNREKGLLVGEGNSAFLSDITQGITIQGDSMVETSGLGGSLPQGILIGAISATRSQKSDLSQSFTVHLAQDPSTVESLFVLLTDPQ